MTLEKKVEELEKKIAAIEDRMRSTNCKIAFLKASEIIRDEHLAFSAQNARENHTDLKKTI